MAVSDVPAVLSSQRLLDPVLTMIFLGILLAFAAIYVGGYVAWLVIKEVWDALT